MAAHCRWSYNSRWQWLGVLLLQPLWVSDHKHYGGDCVKEYMVVTLPQIPPCLVEIEGMIPPQQRGISATSSSAVQQ
ncbi:hypothetical protein COO60DRAFT_1517514 [Scenedesmus sp. NREL 46B-D3]|nr:hypothetical protein COO60DRAFT_1517514 [Scenedesmus sp. NREL 46B-D3]